MEKSAQNPLNTIEAYFRPSNMGTRFPTVRSLEYGLETGGAEYDAPSLRSVWSKHSALPDLVLIHAITLSATSQEEEEKELVVIKAVLGSFKAMKIPPWWAVSVCPRFTAGFWFYHLSQSRYRRKRNTAYRRQTTAVWRHRQKCVRRKKYYRIHPWLLSRIPWSIAV